MTFYEFLQTRVIRDNIRGDFLKDARGNKDLREFNPTGATSLYWYLINRRACSVAIEAGNELWKEYEKLMKKK